MSRDLLKFWQMSINLNKKPSCRWGTARRVRASWNLINCCTNLDVLHLKSPETDEWPSSLESHSSVSSISSFKVIGHVFSLILVHISKLINTWVKKCQIVKVTFRIIQGYRRLCYLVGHNYFFILVFHAGRFTVSVHYLLNIAPVRGIRPIRRIKNC